MNKKIQEIFVVSDFTWTFIILEKSSQFAFSAVSVYLKITK